MGLTHVDATVTGPTGKSQKLELLVDSLLPVKVWKALQLKPMEKQNSPWPTAPTSIEKFPRAASKLLPPRHWGGLGRGELIGNATPPSSPANPTTNHYWAHSPWKFSAWSSIPSNVSCGR